MSRYKTIIIDDERLAREEVKRALEKHQEFEIIGEASHVDEAIPLIEELQPDILFLDISMPGETGFDLLKKIDSIYFEITIEHMLHSYTPCIET